MMSTGGARPARRLLFACAVAAACACVAAAAPLLLPLPAEELLKTHAAAAPVASSDSSSAAAAPEPSTGAASQTIGGAAAASGDSSSAAAAPAPSSGAATQTTASGASSWADVPPPRNVTARPIEHFVQRAGVRFVVATPGADAASCEPFYFSGANSFFLMVRAADPRGRCEVLQVLDHAAELGLTVLRTWAFADGPSVWNALQRAPGVYDENTWTALDFVVHQAALRGIRLLLTFGNYWQHYGGVDQYNAWSFAAGRGTCNGAFDCRDSFFNDTFARDLYKAHIRTLLLRVNTFTGRAYREEPAIFGFDLMNEPRSSLDLVVVQRQAATGPVYNLTFNTGDALQAWIEDMAAFVKKIDPVHLLTVGSEGFFGPSTPLYLYANPGPWASLEGVDFVRNHRAPGIDFAAMHVYVDQHLCTERGATRDGRVGFFRDYIDAHQQAAEEELMMPVILEEFGGKLEEGKRLDLYSAAYDSFGASAARGGGGGGVLFWDLYHAAYAPLDFYGGDYGNFVPPTSGAAREVLDAVRNFSATVAAANAAHRGTDACTWRPPRPLGAGCASLRPALALGAMPWTCLPGEPENVDSCAPAGVAQRLFRDPPPQWRGKGSGKALPTNAVEALVMGSLTNAGPHRINLRGSWVIVPFSRGVETKYEGEWLRILDANTNFTRYCWYAALFEPNGTALVLPYSGDLCQGGGALHVAFTVHQWPAGTKADRGLNISFAADRDLFLEPGQSVAAGHGGREVMISFKAGTTEATSLRLDVSSLEIAGALECPTDPAPPPPPPPPPPPCPHPWRACPRAEWAMPLPSPATIRDTLPRSVSFSSMSNTVPVAVGAADGSGAPLPLPLHAQRRITARVRLSGGDARAVASHLLNGSAAGDLDLIARTTGAGDALAATAAPNPGERFTSYRAQGVKVLLTLRYVAAGLAAPTYLVVGSAEARLGEWADVRGVLELTEPAAADGGAAELFAQALMPGLDVELADVRAAPPWALPAEQADEYTPCQIAPATSPDAVMLFTFNASNATGRDGLVAVDASLCSTGYDQGLRVYDVATGTEVARTDASCSRGAALKGLSLQAGRAYAFVLDGRPGEPYGSWRGGSGIRVTRRDGAAVGGFDEAPSPAATGRFVRAVGTGLYLGCDPFLYAGVNTFDLMDTARYPTLRYLVDARLDDMRSRGLTVGRTWGFSLGTGTSTLQRSQALQLKPGVYDEAVFQGLDYALAQARARGLRLIVCLEDYWLSVDRYVPWSPTAGSKTDFYTDWTIRRLYKSHLRTFVSRVNTVTGIRYREDPTIFAWDLMNEPRCTGCGSELQGWAEEMSLYMKAIDPYHMVTIGEEGFYSRTCEHVYLNPGAGKRRTGIASSPWALQEGQDFRANHRTADIDFMTVHAWPDNWMGFADYSPPLSNPSFDYSHGAEVWREKLDYLQAWIGAHVEDAAFVGKPLLLEEFGKVVPAAQIYTAPSGLAGPGLCPGETVHNGPQVRDLFFSTVYGMVERSAAAGGPTAGSNFWVLYRPDGQGSDDPYRVTIDNTSTFDVVAAHQRRLAALRANRTKVCPAGWTPDMAAQPWPPPELVAHIAAVTGVSAPTGNIARGSGGAAAAAAAAAGRQQTSGRPTPAVGGLSPAQIGAGIATNAAAAAALTAASASRSSAAAPHLEMPLRAPAAAAASQRAPAPPALAGSGSGSAPQPHVTTAASGHA